MEREGALLDDEGFQMYAESMWGNTPQRGKEKEKERQPGSLDERLSRELREL